MAGQGGPREDRGTRTRASPRLQPRLGVGEGPTAPASAWPAGLPCSAGLGVRREGPRGGGSPNEGGGRWPEPAREGLRRPQRGQAGS